MKLWHHWEIIFWFLNLLMSENIETFKLSMTGMDTLLMITQMLRSTYFSVRSYLVMLMMGLLSALGPTLTLHVGDGQIHGAPLLLGIMVSTTTKSKPSGHILTAVDTVEASSSSKSSRGDHHPLGSIPSSLLFWWSTIWFCELLMLGWSKPLWEMLKSS